MSRVLGLHHVSAIAGSPQRNRDFYSGVLGLRLVKRTVNFDDPKTYHLYYADESGTPGSIMTCFPWPSARRGRAGSGQVAVTSFAVLPSAIGFWIERFIRHGVTYEGPTRRSVGSATEQVLRFTDPDGLMLELVGDPSAEERPVWDGAAGILPEQAIHGLHSVTLWVSDGAATGKILVGVLGFEETDESETTRRFRSGPPGSGQLVNVRSIGGFGEAEGGAGTVHHVAFAVADEATQRSLRDEVIEAGMHPTDVIDRKYFQSVYFREPGGVLFELATIEPGFTVDEPLSQLGEGLMLPAWFEPERGIIEAALPAIHLPLAAGTGSVFAETTGPEDVSGEALGYIHRYVPPAANAEEGGGATLLLLHGTGGSETDLLPLGRALLPGAGLLSPRGKVNERGAARFFRRKAELVLDQEDMAFRTGEMAEFIEAAAKAYEFDPTRVIAVGFSNGANLAASLLFRRPGLLYKAVLLSPMLPFEPDPLPALQGTAVFIGAGRTDTIVPAEQPAALEAVLRKAGAQVHVHWEPGGHTITPTELKAARQWLRE